MLINRSVLWLLAVSSVCLLASRAHAQDCQPFGPVEFDQDFQLFAPAELEEYGGEVRGNEGYFFVYERVNWSISRARRTPVGFVAAPDGNSITAAVPNASFAWGNRFDMGYMYEDKGWYVSVLGGVLQNESSIYGFTPDPDNPDLQQPGVVVGFNDPLGVLSGYLDLDGDGIDDDLNFNHIFGRYGEDVPDDDGNYDGVPDIGAPEDLGDLFEFMVVFDKVSVRSKTRLNGVELNKQHRFRPFHNGSVLEVFYGARYLKFRDHFMVDAEGGVLADSNWDTNADNNIVGPQLGVRWYRKNGRWRIASEGRFLAGYNIQNLSQNGELGSLVIPGGQNGPVTGFPTSFQYSKSEDDFSPVAELRIDASYQVTRAMSVKVGWTGLYVGGVVRACNSVDYTVPYMGFSNLDNQEVFAHGVNFGIEVNR